ncbi:MAG: HAD-IIIC family phosphatase [bacterium]|jgi:FkbH-like protein|nr:HAD-IIIC family phosphatase [Rhodocyclaceae bacterium]MCA4901762.1 HAD-IIIC family phosphatase [Rhodocyclaceae bacterium]MCE2979050.1 HAD-IIIC family phosphatase [Betaproteobacteria bacterium]
MFGMKYTEVLRENRRLGGALAAAASPRYRVALLSNTTLVQAAELIEFALRDGGVNASVEIGDFDNIVQESARFAGADAVVLAWELASLVDGFHFRAATMQEAELEALLGRFRQEVSLAFTQLATTPLVIVNTISALPFSSASLRQDALDRFCGRANAILQEAAPRHCVLVDIDKIYAELSVERSIDRRLFRTSRSLYTLDFLAAWAGRLRPCVMSATGRAKKALVFDCDNTLWKGVLGEDGFDGIEMSPETPDGRVFAEVQAQALALQRNGVLLALNTKNNPDDVEEVLARHPWMQLRPETLAGRRVNWTDKVANLRSLADAWNIGLDSMVFVDDSSLEVDLVRRMLPQVTVVQVPERLDEYPAAMARTAALFFQLSVSREDALKTSMYREEAERKALQESATDLDAYVRSLGLTLSVHVNPEGLVPRIAQMTQKTNQFNLTTRRYTEADISRMLADGVHRVLAIGVADRFGDYGISGLCIVRDDRSSATSTIDTFLLSCRVLGRRVEQAVIGWLAETLRQDGILRIEASYVQTRKNEQVADFFDRMGFQAVSRTNDCHLYAAELPSKALPAADLLPVAVADGTPATGAAAPAGAPA